MPTEGQTAINKTNGQMAVFRNGVWVAAEKQQPMEASMRSRTDIGLAPMVQAQQTMADIEARGNPFSLRENPGNAVAEILSNAGIDLGPIHAHPFEGVAKAVGGEDYQAYDQARKAYEAQLMPIMSGAAVSPSEGQRQIRASLPQLGDSPGNLASKGRDREMMVNGAAKAKGLPLPYPNVPTWGVNTTKLPAGARPAPEAGGGPVRVSSPAEAMKLPKGTVFVTPDGRRKVR